MWWPWKCSRMVCKFEITYVVWARSSIMKINILEVSQETKERSFNNFSIKVWTCHFYPAQPNLINKRDMGLDVEIVSITTKPYILQKILNQWICCKCLAWCHGLKKIQPPTLFGRLWKLQLRSLHGFRPRNFSFEKKSFHANLKNVN